MLQQKCVEVVVYYILGLKVNQCNLIQSASLCCFYSPTGFILIKTFGLYDALTLSVLLLFRS